MAGLPGTRRLDIDLYIRFAKLYQAGFGPKRIADLTGSKDTTVITALNRITRLGEWYIKYPYDVRGQRMTPYAYYNRLIVALVNAGIDEFTYLGRAAGVQCDKRLSQDEIDRVAFLYTRMDMSIKQTAKVLGMSDNAVLYRLRVGGIPRRSNSEATRLAASKVSAARKTSIRKAGAKKRGCRTLTDEQEKEVVRLYLHEDMNAREVIEHLNLFPELALKARLWHVRRAVQRHHEQKQERKRELAAA